MSVASHIRVVKCGGSILGSPAAIAAAADRLAAMAGRSGVLIVVVSAPAGATDALFAELSPTASTTGSDVAEHVSQGERQMAAQLARHLQDRGLTARSVSVQQIALHASGPALDADPVSLDTAAILEAAAVSPVLVIPGFAAISASGQCRLLGRGGSDLTAVFLAAELGATCHLMQAAPGIFESDPSHGSPLRFDRLHWDDLLDMDSEVVQAKAVRLAKQRDLPFVVSGLEDAPRTRVGDFQTAVSEVTTNDARA